MAEIVKIKKDGVIQYPITKPECVIDENGKNVLQLIKENGGGSTPDLSGYLTKEEFNETIERYATADELTELSEEVGKKQDTITDLETIRSGAAKGATALQEVPDNYATKESLNGFLKAEPQILSAEQKAAVRNNLGIDDYITAVLEGSINDAINGEY